jgi:hypothetical protein
MNARHSGIIHYCNAIDIVYIYITLCDRMYARAIICMHIAELR